MTRRRYFFRRPRDFSRCAVQANLVEIGIRTRWRGVTSVARSPALTLAFPTKRSFSGTRTYPPPHEVDVASIDRRGAEDEVLLVTLQDRDGTVLFEGVVG